MCFIICYRNSDNRLSNSVKGGVKENYQKKVTYEILPKPQKTISNQTNTEEYFCQKKKWGKKYTMGPKKKKCVCVCARACGVRACTRMHVCIQN